MVRFVPIAPSAALLLFASDNVVVTVSSDAAPAATPPLPCTSEDSTECSRQSFDETVEQPTDYLVIGAGGSGLQTALFLQKHGMSYAVFEKENVVGSFWNKFPVFGELISVNKWVRNETQRLRYDWHSFLESNLTMLDISEDYFPQGSDWRKYMEQAAVEAGIMPRIKFGVEVLRVANDGTPCVYVREGGQKATLARRCANRRVFMGTGLQEKNEPFLRAMGGVPYSQISKKLAYHKRVCILGNGNAGFEVAQNIFNVADRVTIYGKESHRLSSVTRYTGDVRVKFLQILENLHGKLLDTVDKYDYSFRLKGLEDYLNATQIEQVNSLIRAGTFLKQFKCEVFVVATGFRSHVPGLTLGYDERFPRTSSEHGWYVSAQNPSVHYIGWLMHESDFRKGAGGFLSGYRYLIRNLIHSVREADEGVMYPRHILTKEEAIAHALARLQVADDLIILQDGVVLRDAIVPAGNDIEGTEVYHYYEGASFNFHDDIISHQDVVYLYFSWGDGRNVQSVFDNVLRYSDTNTLINLFLHPVVEKNGRTRDMMEDLEQAWNSPGYLSSLEKSVRAALDGDLSLFRPKSAIRPYTRSVVNEETQKEPGYEYEPALEKGLIDNDYVTALWKAVSTNGADTELRLLNKATKKWLPELQSDRDSVVY